VPQPHKVFKREHNTMPKQNSPTRPGNFQAPPTLHITKFRLTFWPRFYISRNYLRNQSLGNDVEQCSISFCTEFRCTSCWHSHLTRLPTLWQKSEGGSNPQYTCSTNPGACFFVQGNKAPQAAATRPQRAGMCSCMSISLSLYLSISLSLYIYIYIYILCICINANIQISKYPCICMHIQMSICI